MLGGGCLGRRRSRQLPRFVRRTVGDVQGMSGLISAALHRSLAANVADGSKTPVQRCPHQVSFPSGSDGIADIPDRQFRANNRTLGEQGNLCSGDLAATPQTAEAVISQQMFQEILRLIAELWQQPPLASA